MEVLLPKVFIVVKPEPNLGHNLQWRFAVLDLFFLSFPFNLVKVQGFLGPPLQCGIMVGKMGP